MTSSRYITFMRYGQSTGMVVWATLSEALADLGAQVADMEERQSALKAFGQPSFVYAAWVQDTETQRLFGFTTNNSSQDLFRPVTMQDVRLAVGEGALKATDVLAGVNAELARRGFMDHRRHV